MSIARDRDESPIYGQMAEVYWDAGWRGILPLPRGSKRISVVGFTGWHGVNPSWPDIEAWREDHPAGNIALRLPGDVIGIDVDNYDGKPGAATFAAHEDRYGPLPPTWRVTSRDDGVSGIRLYRVPEGYDWPGQLVGGGVELIHSGHRYAVVAPSVHPEGRIYRWIDPDGLDSLAVPHHDELPYLPPDWFTGISRGVHVDEPSADMSRAAVTSWLTKAPGGTDQRCSLMNKYTAAAVAGMVDGSSRHDHLLVSILQLVRFGESGHRGLNSALKETRQAFLDAVSVDHSRSPDEAMAECERALAGAVAKVAAAPTPDVHGDPCRPPVLAAALPPTVTPWAPTPERPAPSTPPPTAPLSLIQQALRELDHPSEPAQELGGERVDDTYKVPTVSSSIFPETAAVPVERDRTSWWPVDLEAALRGEHIEAAPTVLARADGVCLLYAGRINGIIGPSESGKTWLALEAIRQVLLGGHRVLLLDFEDTVPGVVGRLLSMGIDPDALRRQFHYVGPHEVLAPLANADLVEELGLLASDDLIVLDGMNAAMTLLGLDLMSNSDVTTFHQALLRSLVTTGACVVYVDHTPKNDIDGESKGGIGAQAKRAMTTGSILKCVVLTPFGRGETGRIKVTVDKDRSGHIREASPGGKAGTAVLASSPGGLEVAITIEAASTSMAPEEVGGYFRPTELMRRVSDYLRLLNNVPASGRSIRENVTGKNAYIVAALEVLIQEGYVSTQAGERGAILHTLKYPFLGQDAPPVPTGSHRGPVVPGNQTDDRFPGSPTHPLQGGGPEPISPRRGSAGNSRAVPALFDSDDDSGDSGDDE